MDNYPEDLRPKQSAPFQKETFSSWWDRARPRVPAVPRNVARQWIWRHWGESEFYWLPSHGAHFQIEVWEPSAVVAVQVCARDDYVEWGNYLMRWETGPDRYRVASIMARRYRWPAPPIVLDHRNGLPFPADFDLPKGFVLVEGNRRSACAKALAQRGYFRLICPFGCLDIRNLYDARGIVNREIRALTCNSELTSPPILSQFDNY
jgi:hypothetical protein